MSVNRNVYIDRECLASSSVKTNNLVPTARPSDSYHGLAHVPTFPIIMVLMNSMYNPSFSKSHAR